MSLYTDLVPEITALLTELGMAMTVRRGPDGDVDPVGGSVAPGDPVELATVGLFVEASVGLQDGEALQFSQAKNNTLPKTARRVLLGPAVEPRVGDRLLAGSEVLRITSVSATRPTDTSLIFEVGVEA